MEQPFLTSRFTFILIFLVSGILVIVDSIEIYVSFKEFHLYGISLDYYVFEKCVKYHMITKIVFSLFSLLAGLSAFLISGLLLINNNFVLEKLIKTFFYWSYLLFGPYFFVVSVIAFWHLNEIAYICDSKDIESSNLSISTLITVIICFGMSLGITLSISVIFVVENFVDSIRFRQSGLRCVGRLFWWCALRNRNENNTENVILNEVVNIDNNNDNNNGNGNNNNSNNNNTNTNSNNNINPTINRNNIPTDENAIL